MRHELDRSWFEARRCVGLDVDQFMTLMLHALGATTAVVSWVVMSLLGKYHRSCNPMISSIQSYQICMKTDLVHFAYWLRANLAINHHQVMMF